MQPCTVLEWDSVGKASRIRIMSALLRHYRTNTSTSTSTNTPTSTFTYSSKFDFDVPRLSRELGRDLCLYLPRVASLLDANLLKRKHSCEPHVRCLGMLLLTNAGQEFAVGSPNIMKTLARTLEVGSQAALPRDKDLIASLIMIRKVCATNEYLRKTMLHLRAMSLISTLLQRVHWSDPLQEAGRSLMLDLASADNNSALALSCVFRKLLNSPQLSTKHSAVKMWTSILYTNSAVSISVDGWESEALQQLTRLLCCAPLAFQYDVSELLALLFSCLPTRHSGLSVLLPQLMKQCGAVLCLRYTLGGGAIVQPPLDWNMKFYSGYTLEAPEVRML
jgi:hypothetical protein